VLDPVKIQQGFCAAQEMTQSVTITLQQMQQKLGIQAGLAALIVLVV